MPNYQNGKIYKIESLEGDCVYYGSTIQKLCLRMAEHRKHYRYNRGITSKEVLCFNDAKIYLVENYPCDSKEELCAREGYYIKNFDCVNKQIAGRTHKQYVIDNKEDVKKYQKQYYQENKEYFKTNSKEYRKKIYICECGKIMPYADKSGHLQTKKHKTLLSNPFINFKL